MAKKKISRTITRNNVSGALRSYVHFQQRGLGEDGWGSTPVPPEESSLPAGEFETKFSVYVNFRPLLRGSATGVENVFADRLQGNQPFIVTARNMPALHDVTISWRILDARNENIAYNIMSPPVDINDGDKWLEFICVQDKND